MVNFEQVNVSREGSVISNQLESLISHSNYVITAAVLMFTKHIIMKLQSDVCVYWS